MSGFWGPWDNDGTWGEESPYVNWWKVSPPPEFSKASGVDRTASPVVTYFQQLLPAGTGLFMANRSLLLSLVPGAKAELDKLVGSQFGDVVPMPGNVINATFEQHLKDNGGDWLPNPKLLPTVGPDTVIVGIIDSGIPIGMTRLRKRGGKETRVLASWQQGAPRPPRGAQPYLPCGEELYESCINELIEKYTVGDHFLAEDFNRAAGLVDMRNPLGTRELAGRLAHGAMVADLAAGADPAESNDRVRIIAVNLPNLATLGSSGSFLDKFVIRGLQRIIDLADAIHAKNRDEAPEADKHEWTDAGFPIVINLSFGKNAGAKDGSDLFSEAVSMINAARKAAGLREVQLVTPVGNHNLEQATARFNLAPGGEDEIIFRTSPGDQTPNYLEIWSDSVTIEDGKPLSAIKVELDISVTPPGAAQVPYSTGSHHMLSQGAGTTANLYCQLHADGTGTKGRICYLLCIAPSLRQSQTDKPTAASGPWTIRLRNSSPNALAVHLSAQTDHATRANSRTGRNPYLERPDYRKYNQTTGLALDSCDDPRLFDKGIADNQAVLRRHGSINATAMGEDVIAVAGFRQSDGRPADYSATGHGVRQGASGRAEPSFAMPTDTSPALFGLLGAGAAEGSVVAMRGTSFAAASATRLATDMLLAGKEPGPDLMRVMTDAAIAAEDQLNATMPKACRTKIGSGRLPSTPQRRINRRGERHGDMPG